MFHIYHLVDPTDKTVRYVGRCTDPKARLRNHCNEAARRTSTQKHAWINALLEAGRIPVLVVVARLSDARMARARESEEIERHRKTVFNLHAPERFPDVIRKKGRK